MPTVAEALRKAARVLRSVSDTARLDAELLMAEALGVPRSDMLLRRMTDEAPKSFEPFVDRRLDHEPIAYIVGTQEFFGRVFHVTPDVLIPRADSEATLGAALAARPDPRRVLDCGTGSGALLLSLLAERPLAAGVGVDRAELRHADWTVAGWTGGLGRFDLVIANPPYVEEAAALDPSVRDHEPAGALFAGLEGLGDYRVLVPQLPALLGPEGAAVLEIGASQADAVAQIAAQVGFRCELRRDLAGRSRALVLRLGLV